MTHILMVFLDGVGLGGTDPADNPLLSDIFPTLAKLAGNQPWTNDWKPQDHPSHVVKGIDANLGLPGLPQSGTGQATLFTGINCAERAGRHFGPFPYSTSKPVIAEHNIFLQLKERGLPVAFANAYPQRFFEWVRRRNRWTVTTLCCTTAEVPLRRTSDLKAGRAVSSDLTGAGWPEQDATWQPVTEAEAGRRLVRIADAHTFTLFEYYRTDKAGHAQDLTQARHILHALDRFFAGVLGDFDPARHLLLITSDHGNLEDLSTKSHTRNLVPLIAYGKNASAFAGVEDLTGVVPGILWAAG